MDNSSRNIVKFIITITGAALLIMAARFYAQSQAEPMPAIAEDVVKSEAAPTDASDDPLEQAAGDSATNPDADPQNPGEEIVEEDANLVMGEPSVNLEQGGASIYNPPAQTEAPTE